MGKSDPAEDLVQHCLSRELHVDVRRVDCNSGVRMPDFEYTSAGGYSVPVEVTTARDEWYTARMSSKESDPWEPRSLTLSWILTPYDPLPFNWRAIRRGIEAPLGVLEALGVQRFDAEGLQGLWFEAEFFGGDARRKFDAVRSIAELGIELGFSHSTSVAPPMVSFNPQMHSNWDGTASAIPAWTADFINDEKRSDNIEKMGDGGHYAIVMDTTLAGYGIFRVVDDCDSLALTPNESPEVPDVVKDI